MSYQAYGGGGRNPFDQRDVESNPFGSDTALNNNYDQQGLQQQRPGGGLPSRPSGNRQYGGGSNMEMQSLPTGPRPGANRAPNPYAQQDANPYSQQNSGGSSYGAGAGTGATGGSTMSPTTILDNCRNIDTQIDELSGRLNQLRNQQRTFLQAPSPNAATIDDLSTQIMDSYRGLGAQLKKIKSQPQSGNNLCASQVGKVDRRLKSAIQEFQRVDSDFRGQVREQQARQYRIVRPDASESEVREAVEDGGGQVFQQALLNSDRRGQAQSALSSVRQRHDAIQKIEQDMIQLAELFQDLDNIVMEQDVMVQNIEQKAEETNEHVDKGVIELGGAVEKARSARRKKWWCLGLSVVIVIVIIIIILIVLKVLGVFGGSK